MVTEEGVLGFDDQEKTFLVGLSSLPGIGVKQLWKLIAGMKPSQAWELLGKKKHPRDQEGHWGRYVLETDPFTLYKRHLRAGIAITAYGDPYYPESLLTDPEPPLVLFSRGDIAIWNEFPRVAVVGTRSASPYGIEVASRMGYDLSLSGIAVISGLAVGIDSACHLGVVDARLLGGAPPIGVAAGGLDKVYPAKQLRLWKKVIEEGVLLSERPLGTAPLRRLFPIRNRIIAGLADVIVVVESQLAGGSLHTVDAGISRGTTVLAVPGSVRSPSSEGSNALIFDGCGVARDAADVLAALSLEVKGGLPGSLRHPQGSRTKGIRMSKGDMGTTRGGAWREFTSNSLSLPRYSEPSEHSDQEERGKGGVVHRNELIDPHPTERGAFKHFSQLSSAQRSVLEAIGWEPVGMETLLKRTTMSMGRVALCLAFLEHEGWIEAGNGWWMRRRTSQ